MKKKKIKKLFRKKFWLPLIVVVGCAVPYFIFLFDASLKIALEQGGTMANGAEVNIRSLKSSFTDGYIDIRGIEVTDAKNPELNLVEIGKIRFDFLWDALLRAKFVVEEASLNDVELYSKREYPGRVLPVSKDEEAAQSEKEKEDETNAQLEAAKERLRKKIDELTSLQEIEDIKNMKLSDLPSAKQIEQLQIELDGKKEEWNNIVSSLPKKEDFAKDKKELMSLTKIRDPRKIKEALAKVKKIKNSTVSRLKEVQNKGRDIQKGIKDYKNSLNGLDKLVAEDRKYLEEKLKLPDLDFKDITKDILGPELYSKVEQIEGYIKKARSYMGSSSGSEQEKKEVSKSAQPQVATESFRSKGKNYSFGSKGDYPLFWLRKMEVSSKESEEGFSGNLAGKITDVNTSPKLVGRPTMVDLKGDFRKSDVEDFSFNLTMDHLGEKPKESFSVKIGKFKVPESNLSKSENISVAIGESRGRLDMTTEIEGDILKLQSKTQFLDMQYQIDAKKAKVKDLMTNAMSNIGSVHVNADAEGPFSSLKWTITSNLSQALKEGFSKALKDEVDAAKDKVKKVVEERIANEKAKLQAKVDEIKNKVMGQVSGKKEEAKNVQNMVQKKGDQFKGGLDAKKKALQDKLNAQKKKLEEKKRKAKKEAEKKAKKKLLKNFGL